MPAAEFLLVLLVGVAGLATLAGALNVPYPILLLLGGLVVGLVPGIPDIRLDPDLVLVLFLPPLLYHAAFLTSPRELRAEARSVGLLAIGLVLITMLVVAFVAHEIVGRLSWPEAFLLGTIVAPTDPVAATAVFRRLHIPARLTTILEGESLVNDGTALVAFGVALTAATTGSFHALDAGGRFVLSSVGGVGIGLLAGRLVKLVRSRLDDPPVEITISLLTAYLAYLPAEEIGASGVLAAVTVGLYLAYQTPTGLFHPGARLQAVAFWDVLVFLLESILFVLVGLQVRGAVSDFGNDDSLFLLGGGAAVCGAVVLSRIVWMIVVPRLTSWRETTPPTRDERILIGWSGIRGAVSLAAALSLPFSVDGRPLILIATFAVIVVTLVGQGLTLAPLARRLHLPDRQEQRTEAEANARRDAARAALSELDRLAAGHPAEAVAHARAIYEMRLRHLDDKDDAQTLPATRELARALGVVERNTFERLHADGELDQEAARRLERELDLGDERRSELESSELH